MPYLLIREITYTIYTETSLYIHHLPPLPIYTSIDPTLRTSRYWETSIMWTTSLAASPQLSCMLWMDPRKPSVIACIHAHTCSHLKAIIMYMAAPSHEDNPTCLILAVPTPLRCFASASASARFTARTCKKEQLKKGMHARVVHSTSCMQSINMIHIRHH
jgi:hypothetical protein